LRNLAFNRIYPLLKSLFSVAQRKKGADGRVIPEQILKKSLLGVIENELMAMSFVYLSILSVFQ